MQGKPREQRQRARRRIAEAEMDHGRAHEIARAVKPFPPLPPAPGGLAVGDQPVAFGDRFGSAEARGEVGIGRAGSPPLGEGWGWGLSKSAHRQAPNPSEGEGL